jgi:hypothetical protein
LKYRGGGIQPPTSRSQTVQAYILAEKQYLAKFGVVNPQDLSAYPRDAIGARRSKVTSEEKDQYPASGSNKYFLFSRRLTAGTRFLISLTSNSRFTSMPILFLTP